MDEQTLKNMIDAVFIGIESAEKGHPIILAITEGLRQTAESPAVLAIIERAFATKQAATSK